MAKPSCGINKPGGLPSATTIVTGTVSAVATIASTAATIVKLVTAGSAAAISYIVPAAAAVGVIIVAIVVYFTVERCRHPAGKAGCTAGVIEAITPAFSGSAADAALKFSSQHDRVDVVVKSAYWDLIDALSDYGFCAADESPIMPCFYYNPAVCNAGKGAAVGAAVGAAAGILLAAAAVAAIGCASWILCILALIVALILVIAAAILGAVAGGEIGAAATTDPVPSSTGTALLPARPLSVGDYVTTQGTLIKSGDLHHALVFYFVTTTTLHGRSIKHPSFSYTDPDQHLISDACGLPLIG